MPRPRKLPVTLTDAEVQALVAQIPTRSATGLRNRALVEIMLGAGLRISEALALMPADVDLDRGMVRVNKGKGAKDRVVPIDHETLGWLRAWMEKRAALGFNARQVLFCGLRNRGRPLRPWQVQRMLARVAKAAGIHKRVSPHVLRHTYATRLLRDGFTIREVQELLGHANVATTQIYTHVDPEALREKIQGRQQSEAEKIARALLEKLPADVVKALARLAGEGG